jgi:DNA modification methylase
MSKAIVYTADSRSLKELEDGNVHLVVTSPPYWHIKDYGVKKQIGFGQTIHKYLKDLYLVWKECFRVLKPGRRLCINIGDQFTRAKDYGKYKIIPLHAEFISQCEDIGFDYMGSIIWQKRTTMKTSGGANIMGSYPYPPNGMVEFDYEYILIFKKPGKSTRIDKKLKEASKLTKTDWKQYFSGHWKFGGARQVGHEAMFPDELPKRLIKMFCFKNETVLDPFVGSGTTLKVAKGLGRDGVGYEINPEFIKMIERKVGKTSVELLKRTGKTTFGKAEYKPSVPGPSR